MSNASYLYESSIQPYVIKLNKVIPVIVRARTQYVSTDLHIEKFLHIGILQFTATLCSG